MNKIFLTGNLTRDPDLRQTKDGIPVCSFDIAVNRRKPDENGNSADFFKITVWRQLGEICAKFLAKGRKVAVVGAVSCRVYTGRDGLPKATLEVTAEDVEFLTPKGEQAAPQYTAPIVQQSENAQKGFVPVPEEELPF